MAFPSISSKIHKIILTCLVIAIASVYVSGIIGDLPFSTHIDEPVFVQPAIHIASEGNLNPHWFGNPGSTIIYPLAGLYHVWYSVRYQQPIWKANRGIEEMFLARPAQFYILGRLLNLIYGLLSIGLVYHLGKKLFRPEVALLSVLFFGFNAITVQHLQLIRTDTAAIFWSTLTLIFLIRLFDRPSLLNQLLVAISIGFSIGTRYFLVALIPLLVLIDVYHFIQQPGRFKDRSFWFIIGIGFIAIPFFFFVSTPYFFADFETARMNLAQEARLTHIGADGLSPVGNFLFYIFQTLPSSIYLPQEIFALIGGILILFKKQFRLYIFPIYSLGFLVGISLHSLHWDRWVIPLFPIFALLSALTLYQVSSWISRKINLRQPIISSFVLPTLILVSAALPTYHTIIHGIQYLNPSTNIIARTWVFDHIPKGSSIVTELYSTPKLDPDYKVLESVISYNVHGVDAYVDQGYDYLIVSQSIYYRFYAEPDRYQKNIQYYENLFNNYPLLFEIKPSITIHGPVIRVYKIDVAAQAVGD